MGDKRCANGKKTYLSKFLNLFDIRIDSEFARARRKSFNNHVRHDNDRLPFLVAGQRVDGKDRAGVEQLLVGLISCDFDFSDEVLAFFGCSKQGNSEEKQFLFVI
jgi:hypothetical protein